MDALEELALAMVRDELEFTGPSTVARLAGAVAERLEVYLDTDVPIDRADDLVHSLCFGPSSVRLLGDGRVVDLAEIASGIALPHQLSADEVEGDRLDLYPDLAVLARVAAVDGGLHDPIGTPLALRTERRRTGGPRGTDLATASLQGPKGWLAAFDAGSTVSVTATDGIVRLEARPAVASELSDGVVASLHAAIDAHEEGEPVDGTPRDLDIVQAMALIDRWWAPSQGPPFGEVIAVSDLEVAGDQVGRPDSWARWAELTAVIAPIARHRNLCESSLRVISDMVKAASAEPVGPIPLPSDAVLRTLSADPDLVASLLHEVRRLAQQRTDDPAAADALTGAWVEALPRLTGTRGIGVDALRARWALIQGDIDTATDLAERVNQMDPHFHPAVELLAELAANAGDLQRTAALLRHVRYPDDRELAALEDALRSQNPNIGRNEPCPCGSGRRYKQCHLGRREIATTTQVTWLLDQGREFVRTTAPPGAIRAMADDLGPLDHVDDDLVHAIEQDLALFDHGWLARFRHARASVLSPEHQMLLDAWLAGASPAVYRVEDAGNETLGFVDTQTDDWYEVGRSGSLDVVRHGMEVWARLVPAGACWWTSGICVPVPATADPDALIAARTDDAPGAWLRALLTPAAGVGPTAPDGTPRVRAMVSISFDGIDCDGLVEALDEAFPRAADEHLAPWCWDVPLTSGGSARIAVTALMFEAIASSAPELADLPRAQLDPLPHDLGVSADSVARHDDAIAQIMAVLSGAGAAPSVGERTIIPWARDQALEERSDLLAAAEHHDDWADDWDDDGGDE